MSNSGKQAMDRSPQAPEEVVSSIQEEEISELKDRIKELEGRIEEQNCTNLRLRADFENYRKHLEKEKEDYMNWAKHGVLFDLLDVVDNFERALPQLRAKDPDGAEGMEMVYRQLCKVLEKHGLQRIDSVGKKFDTSLHEAFLQEGSDGPEGMVLEELQAGYLLNGKVLRPSKVKVSKSRS